MKVSRAIFAPMLLVPVAASSPGAQIRLASDHVFASAKHLIELAPGQTEWMTEEETLELIRSDRGFFDVTENPDFGSGSRPQRTFVFPRKPTHQEAVQPLLKPLSKKNMEDHLDVFTSFRTRYYRSDTGRQSSEWLLKQVNDTIAKAGAHEHGVQVEHFRHPWGQHSIIATIPGRSNKRVVIGAHQDSINKWLPWLAAPGADDDGSGTVTILEAFRALLGSADLVQGKADNTLEFHWYSAEEAGLLGSQAIFSAYEEAGVDVRAMLQQDMTGYVQGMLDAGQPESMGVIMDFVHPGLTAFVKEVIIEYCDIPFTETKCGYACSDHASASKAGYPSAFVIESAFEHSNQKIHTPDDLVGHLSFDHMLQHAKMTAAFAYELAYCPFDELAAAPLV